MPTRLGGLVSRVLGPIGDLTGRADARLDISRPGAESAILKRKKEMNTGHILLTPVM